MSPWTEEIAIARAWTEESGFDVWDGTGADDLKWEEDESVWG